MTKTLRKAIVYRSKLQTKYLQTKIQTDLKLYKRQKNFEVNYTRGKEKYIMSH